MCFLDIGLAFFVLVCILVLSSIPTPQPKQKMKLVIYSLIDSFNDRHISNHHTLTNALKARQKHAKKWRKNNGWDACVYYKVVKSDDTFITRDEMIAAEVAAALY